jgi:heavy metal sensor kinase
MTRWWRPLGMRVRLTFWHVAAMIVVLAVYAAGVFAFVSRSVSHALDGRLRGDYTWAEEMWEQRPVGTLTWFEADEGGQDEDKPWLQVWSPKGELLFRTAAAKRIPVPQSAALASRADGQIVPVAADGEAVRVLTRATTVGGKGVIIQVARSEAPLRQELRDLTLFLALGLPFGVAAAGVGGYALARGALTPLQRMAERARSINAARLNDRLPVENPHDELGTLASVFNDTLARLEGSFQQMKQFTADVSHQLRTPLTAIRTVGEVGLREGRSPDKYRRIIGSMLEEADRLTCLIDRLLTLSRTSGAPVQLCNETVDLRGLADDVASHLSVLAEENGQSIVVDQVGSPWCEGDRLMLRQALINLVDNAIKYSPADTEILVRVVDSRTGPTLEVSDRGPGIAPERRALIFERCYRVSPESDSRGAGLGLAISKWAVEAHHGHLSWEHRAGGGSTFRITMPRAAGEPLAAAG